MTSTASISTKGKFNKIPLSVWDLKKIGYEDKRKVFMYG